MGDWAAGEKKPRPHLVVPKNWASIKLHHALFAGDLYFCICSLPALACLAFILSAFILIYT